MEALDQRHAAWRFVRVREHDLGHVDPPTLADIRLGDRVPALFALDFGIAEEVVGFGIEVDRVVRDAVLAQSSLEFRPNRIVAASVFLRRTGLDFKEKSFADFHGLEGNSPAAAAANANIRFPSFQAGLAPC